MFWFTSCFSQHFKYADALKLKLKPQHLLQIKCFLVRSLLYDLSWKSADRFKLGHNVFGTSSLPVKLVKTE